MLLDTQITVLAGSDANVSLPPRVTAIINDSKNERYVSSISMVDLAVRVQAGKLKFTEEQFAQVTEDILATVIPFTAAHAKALFSLPRHHGDPFDRMIIATAIQEDLTLIGCDHEYEKYKGLKTVWH